VLTEERLGLLAGVEADLSLLEPERLRDRLDVLDALEAGFGDADAGLLALDGDSDGRSYRRAQAIRGRLEAVNAELYRSLRVEIALGNHRETLPRWFQLAAGQEAKAGPAPGLGYDWQDELLSGVLRLRDPGAANLRLGDEMVFYQPTPTRHILRLIAACELCEGDVLVDLGSGLGHVPLLVSLLTGVECVGIEAEAAYVWSALECAESLNLSKVRFVHEDARTADLSDGTVVYLYTPFTGSILADVLGRLRRESLGRRIRVCSLGPCTETVAQEGWLRASGALDEGQIAVFRSG